MGERDNVNMLMFMENFSEDAFRVKKAYIDATGDLVAGILLGQVVYWCLPNKSGNSKLRVFKEGYYWIAKSRDEWWQEIRISAKQFDRASKILQEKKLIITKLFNFDGKPTVHIRLDFDVLVDSILPDGENGFYPKGKMDFTQRGKSSTEITTKITTDKDIVVTNVPSQLCKDVIEYLNLKANRTYKCSTKKTQSLINARAKEGFTLADFKQVIDTKVLTWLGDEKMDKFLRPDTLFANKFEGYLNEKPIRPKPRPQTTTFGGLHYDDE